ncbi:MAG: dUTP diphosphatase [Myxococcaceae bacterium]
MAPVTVKFRRVRPSSTSGQQPLPKYQTAQSAGLDLSAELPEDVWLDPGERRLIPTGWAIELPPGYEGQVRPRSGLALKQGLTCLNSPGTIDADYRGEVGVILINHSKEAVVVKSGDRIAQLVIAPVVQANLIEVDQLSDSDRGAGGFGSTGSGR